MQIDYVKISCKEGVHICYTNFTKKMERNLHETTSRWKTYGKHMENDCFPRTLKFEMWHLVGKRGVKADPWEWGGLGFDFGWWRLIP
jgi:hypothetical protein